MTDFEEFLSDAGNVRYLVSCLRSNDFGGTLEHVPRAAGVADHGTQTGRTLTLTATREVSTMATPTFSPSGARTPRQ